LLKARNRKKLKTTTLVTRGSFSCVHAFVTKAWTRSHTKWNWLLRCGGGAVLAECLTWFLQWLIWMIRTAGLRYWFTGWKSGTLCSGYNYNFTSIRRALDVRSTAYERSLRS